MKIIIEKTDTGLEIDLGTKDWDLTEVIGMLERAKMSIWKSTNIIRTDQEG